MIRLYAELSKLFLGFYRRRSDLNPAFSAAALHTALQLLAVEAVFLIGASQRLWNAPPGPRYGPILAVGMPLLFANALYLHSPARRIRLLARVVDDRCLLAKASIIAVVATLVLAILLSRG